MNQLLAALVNGALLGALVTAAVWLVLRLVPRCSLNAPLATSFGGPPSPSSSPFPPYIIQWDRRFRLSLPSL